MDNPKQNSWWDESICGQEFMSQDVDDIERINEAGESLIILHMSLHDIKPCIHTYIYSISN